MSVVAIVVAAGRGDRLGAGQPKALVELQGLSLAEHSVRALAAVPAVAAVQLVLPAARLAGRVCSRPPGGAELLPPVAGGATRQASVAAGLEAACAARPDADWVLVHDAARCLVEPADAEAVLAAARATGAALPVLAPADTVKRLDGSRVVETLDRAALGLAQTPQAFRVALLAEALAKAESDGFEGTDCASLVERLGVEVRVCAGRPGNFKVTHPEDLRRAGALLGAREPGP